MTNVTIFVLAGVLLGLSQSRLTKVKKYAFDHVTLNEVKGLYFGKETPCSAHTVPMLFGRVTKSDFEKAVGVL
jgi:hypothetical protein